MTPHEAYLEGLNTGPADELRRITCQSSWAAYNYARYVDRGPHDDTRAAVLGDPRRAYLYAIDVDKCPRDDTRSAARGSSYLALMYAMYVDQCTHPDTCAAASTDDTYRSLYADAFPEKDEPVATEPTKEEPTKEEPVMESKALSVKLFGDEMELPTGESISEIVTWLVDRTWNWFGWGDVQRGYRMNQMQMAVLTASAGIGFQIDTDGFTVREVCLAQYPLPDLSQTFLSRKAAVDRVRDKWVAQLAEAQEALDKVRALQDKLPV